MEVPLFHPIDVRRRRLETVEIGGHEVAGLVLDQPVSELRTRRIGIVDISDRTSYARDLLRDAAIALAPDTGWPRDRRVRADSDLPVGADLGKVIGPVERGARSVGAVDDKDGQVR